MDWIAVFLIGFATSFHCIGMCGPIIFAYSGVDEKRNDVSLKLFAKHFAYNGGRLLTYTLLGAILGAAGGFVYLSMGLQYYLSFILGLLLVLFGIAGLDFLPFKFVYASLGNTAFFQALTRRTILAESTLSKFYLGLLTGFLPCGPLYAMLAKAMSTGSAFEGAFTMFVFTLGTVPTLFVLGVGASLITHGVRKWGNRIAYILIIIMGIFLMMRGVKAYKMNVYEKKIQMEQTGQAVPASQTPCCSGTH